MSAGARKKALESGAGASGKLRDAIEAFAEERAPELVAEARGEALAKARAMLSDAMTEALLARSAEAIPAAPPGGRQATPTPPPPARRTARRVADVENDAGERAEEPVDALAQYVYGVVSAGAELPTDLVGVDQAHRAGLVEEGGLAAIVSPVPLAEFGEESLRDNLNDIDWLEAKARAHEAVLDAALSATTVVPMRLCTIYSSAAQVREMLTRERPVLLDALGRLEGRSEWGAKLIAEPGALGREAARRAGEDEEEDQGSSGTAYMKRKRRQALARDEEAGVAEDWAVTVHEALAEVAAEALLNPVQRPEVSGHEGEMILNGVYLVEDGRVEELQGRAGRLAEELGRLGLSVELTGPWPPYNFVKSSIEAAR